MRARGFLVAFGAALIAVVSTASATAPSPRPFRVVASKLTQSGKQLSWSVRLSQPFRPAALARSGRNLCLLIYGSTGPTPTAYACVVGPRRRGRPPRLAVGLGAAPSAAQFHFVRATVTRAGSRQLTGLFDLSSVGLRYRPTRWQVSSGLRAPGCTPAAPGATGVCAILFPRRPKLLKLHLPQLVGCVPSGAPFVTQGPTDEGKVIALTFDDGPWVQTAQFLTVLEHYNVHATFFEIGRQISQYGEGGAIERRMLADGDMIGDHTWSHPDVAGGGAFASNQIAAAAAAIKSATRGFEPCLFRAPYGDVSPALFSVAESLGFKTIQWDIDPRDWSLPGVAAIYGNVLANAHPGAIVIQHDGGGNRSETLAALPIEIQGLERRGYRFVTITQLFGMRLLYR